MLAESTEFTGTMLLLWLFDCNWCESNDNNKELECAFDCIDAREAFEVGCVDEDADKGLLPLVLHLHRLPVILHFSSKISNEIHVNLTIIIRNTNPASAMLSKWCRVAMKSTRR